MSNWIGTRAGLQLVDSISRLSRAMTTIATEMLRHNDANDAIRADAAEVFTKVEAERLEMAEDLAQPVWQYKILGHPYEHLVCPKCKHEFLVKMWDLDGGAAAWVWCPLCKTKTPIHMEDNDAS
jgi:hypothetical protein